MEPGCWQFTDPGDGEFRVHHSDKRLTWLNEVPHPVANRTGACFGGDFFRVHTTQPIHEGGAPRGFTAQNPAIRPLMTCPGTAVRGKQTGADATFGSIGKINKLAESGGVQMGAKNAIRNVMSHARTSSNLDSPIDDGPFAAWFREFHANVVNKPAKPGRDYRLEAMIVVLTSIAGAQKPLLSRPEDSKSRITVQPAHKIGHNPCLKSFPL
ncbi:MAG TPA: hypothetical protein VMJ12_00305 [Candidatus Acidoferrales bacterium]|nr:hypothetical protein [Candidatus Acidoferrales bacterium]